MIYGLDLAVTESQNNKLNIIKCISFIDESQQAGNRVPSTPALVREAFTESGGLQVTSLLLSRTLTAMTPVVGHIPELPRDHLSPKGHLALAGTLHHATSAARKDTQKAILPQSQDQAEADQIHTRTEAFKNATVFHE